MCVWPHVCVLFHTMSVLSRHANVPRGHLKLSTRPLMGKFMFILSPLVTASSGVQSKKRNTSISHFLIPCPHQSHISSLNQFLSSAPFPSFSLSPLPWIVYLLFLLLHHSFTAPLLSRHTLISRSERRFLRRACGKTGGSDGSLRGCFTLSTLQGGNGMGLGKGSSRGRVGLTVGVLGEVVLGRKARYKLLWKVVLRGEQGRSVWLPPLWFSMMLTNYSEEWELCKHVPPAANSDFKTVFFIYSNWPPNI